MDLVLILYIMSCSSASYLGMGILTHHFICFPLLNVMGLLSVNGALPCWSYLTFFVLLTAIFNEVLFINYRKNRTQEESQKQPNCKYCRLGLIEPIHGRFINPSTHNINSWNSHIIQGVIVKYILYNWYKHLCF